MTRRTAREMAQDRLADRMTIHYQGHGVTLHHGDCLDVLRALPDASVDSVVTDPPYGLEFMGKEWDKFRTDDPGTNRHRGERAGKHGETVGEVDESLPSRPSGVLFDKNKRQARGVSYGAGKRPTTNVCEGCGKRDQFRNPHPCPEGTAWRSEILNPHAAPPSSLAFQEWCTLWAAECLRVLKPGGHLLAFGGTRTWHRLACAVEDAGFEVRDSIAWLYGSGFPKSLDVSKAIDKRRHDGADIRRVTAWVAATRTAAGVTNRDIDAAFGFNGMAGHWTTQGPQAAIPTLDHTPALLAVLGISVEDVPDEIRALLIDLNGMPGQPGPAWFAREITQAEARPLVSGETISFDQRSSKERERRDIPATPDAERWQGWGTALKPSHEPIVCARKPFSMVPLDWRLVATVHHALAGLLWLSLSPAKRAELTSPSSPAGHGEAWCASARVSAAMDTSRDGYAETDTFSSQALASTSLSIASSWSATLAALSDPTTMSTTSTASSTTTALTTLNSLLAPLTSPSTMPPCACLTSGSSSSAPSAGSDSTDEWARWLHTLSASVPASAIEGIALVVASALAQVAASLSADLEVASSADPSATTGADASPSPAFEPVVVARKPLIGTVSANVLAHGTGALNIDGCRINPGDAVPSGSGNRESFRVMEGRSDRQEFDGNPAHSLGRWPANVVLDESQAAELDAQTGVLTSGSWDGRRNGQKTTGILGEFESRSEAPRVGDSGGASRFFPTFRYEAKAPTAERPRVGETAHPTVKPLDLMRWLVRLVTPPGGTVLEPFAGSGTTVEACIVEGFDCIAIEKGDEYLPLIMQRIHRRRDPVAAIRQTGDELGLFELDGEGA